MDLFQSNPEKPRQDREGKRYWAFAPYNFIPLPDRVVAAPPPLDHDRYTGITGWIDCTLETCSPTYVRGMMTETQFRASGKKEPSELTLQEKLDRAPFFQIEDVPVIPGSTLRGMIRSLIEIIGYGRMRWVGKQPTITYRAVAAPTTDPLRGPYEQAIGRFGSRVRAGYLIQRGEKWFIRPARTPKEEGIPGATDDLWLKVNENLIRASQVEGFRRFEDPNYKPFFARVSFDVQPAQGKRGTYLRVTNISSRLSEYRFQGSMLVGSGNMLETKQRGVKHSPRKKHALLFAMQSHNRDDVPIPPEVVRDYLDSLTPFQKEALKAWNENGEGCLRYEAPVFYVEEDKQVAYFGHSPNFRVPMRAFGTKRAATPFDLLPPEMRGGDAPDFADALFGWVEEEGIPLKEQRAGRVSFMDARFTQANGAIWYRTEPMIPRTLSSPKATTFQHYLIQDKQAGHNPDDKKSLAHYGMSLEETALRGFKWYWHRGDAPALDATSAEREHEDQLTRIQPINAGVQFAFRIYFENLRKEEVGALWWALTLPGDADATYRHKLGMGKPLGMGAVKLTPTLFVTKRAERYQYVFGENHWEQGAHRQNANEYLAAFENYVLRELGVPEREHLTQLERIQMLLEMHRFPGPNPGWTRYMQIEHDVNGNEYKERPVLPDPLAVLEQADVLPLPLSVVSAPTVKVEKRTVEIPAGYRTGTISTFPTRNNPDMGYIEPDDQGEDVRFYRNHLAPDARDIKKGDRVRFKSIKGQNREQARDIHKLEE